jgi:restriction endonuclease S subunit
MNKLEQTERMKENNENGFKETEIGFLPEDWEVIELKKVGKIITGNTPPKKNKEYWQNGEIDFIKPPDLQNKFIETFSEKISKKAEKIAKIVDKGAILVSCIGIIGRTGYSTKKISFNQQINAIEPYEDVIDNLFLFYAIQSEKSQIENMASFTTVPIVNKSKFSKVKIPYPHLSEQKKIAFVLSKIQQAIEQQNKIIEATKELKKSLMNELFTKGVVLGFMFDTNIFNRILDNELDISAFDSNYDYFVTHVQRDEIEKCRNEERKQRLLEKFKLVPQNEIPTESFVLGTSKLGKAKLGDGKLLEKIRKSNLKHTNDALIGETAIKNNLILVTEDEDLRKKVNELGGEAISLLDFQSGNYRVLKKTEIGEIPNSWKVTSLGDLYNKKTLIFKNGFPCGIWNNKKIGTPQLRPFNISEDGIINLDELKYIQTDKAIDQYVLKKEDIIFNNTNSEELVGKTSIWDKEGVFVLSNHMTFIRISNKEIVNPFYLAYFLHKKWFDRFYLSICRRHVNQASISINRIKEVKLFLPPIVEQKKIALIFQKVDKKLEVAKAKKSLLQELFNSMLHQLMTGQIRVKDIDLGVIDG